MIIQYFKIDDDDPWCINTLGLICNIGFRINECEWIVPGTVIE